MGMVVSSQRGFLAYFMAAIGAVALIAGAASSAHAAGKVLRLKNQEFTDICPIDARTGQREDCGIKKLFFQVEDHAQQSWNDKFPFVGTVLRAGMEGSSWEAVQKYGFVQFIRGCTYAAQRDANGNITKRVAEALSHLGKRQTFAFPDWSYDANTTDPLYYGPPLDEKPLKGGRLALYRWTPKIGTYERNKTKDLYEILALSPKKLAALPPRLFVIDTPSMAYYSEVDKSFSNVALEFKMCLFKLDEIPTAITAKTVMPEPIFCYDWDSQFEFNFVANKYDHKPGKGLDPFCAAQIAESPAAVWRREVQGRTK